MSADVKKVDPKQVKRLKFAGTAYAVVLIVVLLGLYALGFFNTFAALTGIYWVMYFRRQKDMSVKKGGEA